MNSIKIRAGARLAFNVERASEDAVSATFIAQNEDATITDTVAYDDDGIATFEFDENQTSVVGVYDYQINENYATGAPDIYPDVDDCDGDCDLPTLEICESLAEGS